MRTAFFKSLFEIAKDRPDIVVLSGDLGFTLFDDFKASCPDRFYDVGVAETNMIGIAAGLALAGKTVYCYTIIPFLLMRSFEHIRVDVAHHNLNVKLIGVGGGFAYGMEGFTHFGLEDLALMKTLPKMTIVAPADPLEAQCLAWISSETKGPMFVRLGKTGDPAVHRSRPDFRLGKAMTMVQGRRVAIFAIGSMVSIAQRVLEILRDEGLYPTLINMHTFKPLDRDSVVQTAGTHEIIITLEEHYIDGGLGTAIGEILLGMRYNGLFQKIGIPESLANVIGSHEHLRRYYGLIPERIAEDILKIAK